MCQNSSAWLNRRQKKTEPKTPTKHMEEKHVQFSNKCCPISELFWGGKMKRRLRVCALKTNFTSTVKLQVFLCTWHYRCTIHRHRRRDESWAAVWKAIKHSISKEGLEEYCGSSDQKKGCTPVTTFFNCLSVVDPAACRRQSHIPT